MNNKILTIVIAAYNMEQFLPKCIDSVVNHPNIDDIEILVINDGSKDETLSIALRYQEKHSDTVRVIDKLNGGWGTAINRGIKEARGKYFKILDSDDWYDTEEFVKFIALLKNIDVDLVTTSFTRVYENKKEKDIYDFSICDKISTFKEYLKSNNYTKHLPMQAITFKTELLQSNGIVLSDRYYTDIEYNLIPLVYVNTIYFSQINLYQYYLGREGQSVSLTGYKKHLIDYINMCKKLILFYENHQSEMSEEMNLTYSKDMMNIIRFSYELLLSPLFETEDVKRKEEAKKFDLFIKENSMNFYKKANKIKKKSIPYICIWRITGFNLLAIR